LCGSLLFQFLGLRTKGYKVSSIINTLFPPLREALYVGRVKLFAEASELFAHALVLLLVVRKTAFSECILQGAKKLWKSDGAKSGL
jgi:hypothetical protein